MASESSPVPVDKQAESLKTLSNAIALGTNTVMHIAGSDIANSLNGEQITEELVANLIAAKLQKKLNI